MPCALHEKLRSEDIQLKVEAIIAIAREQRHEFAKDILDLFASESSAHLKGRAAWALGKLHCREAYGQLITGLRDTRTEVRTWSAWALGETPFYEAEPLLIQSGEKEANDEVRRAIFGAVKKLRLEPTRTHVSQVARLLKPPATRDPRVQQIVEGLASLESLKDRDRIVALRLEMQEADPPYFALYMAWVKRRPTLEQAITDPRYVYSDDEPLCPP